MFEFKKRAAYSMFIIVILLFINPLNVMYRRVRYSLFTTFANVVIAPIGNIRFKAYLLTEILSDCIIQMEDVGKCVTYIVEDAWNV